MLVGWGEKLMPKEIKDAINWAIEQCHMDDFIKVCVVENGKINRFWLTHYITVYFNVNDIDYETFRFSDVEPHLMELGYQNY